MVIWLIAIFANYFRVPYCADSPGCLEASCITETPLTINALSLINLPGAHGPTEQNLGHGAD